MLSPMTILNLASASLLAAQDTGLGNESALKVALILAPFTDGPDLVATDLTLGSTGGVEPLAAGAAPHEVYREPGTKDSIIQINEPAGGWHWTTSSTGPFVVYGVALLNNDLSVLYGVEPIEGDPVTLDDSGLGFDWGRVYYRIPFGTI